METSSCSISAHLFKSSGLSNASNKCVDLFGDAHSVPVGRVHHVYDGVRVGVVTPPVRPAKSWENISDFSETPTFYPNSPNTCLSSQVPHLELEVLVSHLLHIEADRWDCRHNLADLIKFGYWERLMPFLTCPTPYLQSIEECGLSGSVQTQDEDPHLAAAEEVAEVAHEPSHGAGDGSEEEDQGLTGEFHTLPPRRLVLEARRDDGPVGGVCVGELQAVV